MKLFDICIIAILTAIIFTVEQLIIFLPNIQLTFLLLFVYSRVIKAKKTLFIIIIHVLLDSIFMGAFNIIFMLPMLIGYSLVPLLLNSIFKNINSSFSLAVISILFSLIYCYLFLFVSILIINVNFLDYLLADIPFQILICLSSFLSVLWLCNPLIKKMKEILDMKYEEE